MKILIILPRMKPITTVNYNYTFPLGLGYISSVLKEAEYDVDCLNMNHRAETVDEIMKEELKKKYDVVMTGNVWFGYVVIKEIIEATRKYSPTSKIIIGGSIVTSDPETIMESLKPDFGIIGEGEVTILDLLDCIEMNEDPITVVGIIFFNNKKELMITNPREVIEDINTIPYPDFDGFEYDKYLDEMYPNMMYFNNHTDNPRAYFILTARGCPFNCTFCYHSLGKKYRKRNIQEVIKELEWAINKYEINTICINDDLLSIDKERLNELCDGLKELRDKCPWDLKWSCQLAVSSVDDKMLKKMKEAGCDCISYGFESYSVEVLKSMKKPITPEQIDKAIKLTMKNKISIQGNFIFGDVAETRETTLETLEYWKNNCKGQVNLTFIQPYPGSEIFNHCIEKGIIKDKLEYMAIGSQQETFFNITNKMTDMDIHYLHSEIMRLRVGGYYKIAIPKNIRPTEKINRWEVDVECPFCHKDITYKNYYFNIKTFYRDYIICRNCNMRFYISRPIWRK